MIDGEFRVHGTDHLRVVDASVLPVPVSAVVLYNCKFVVSTNASL